MKQRVVVSLLLLALLLGLIPALAQGSTEIIGGDEASLRAYIKSMVGPGPFDDTQTQVYIAQLPDDLPFDVPLPDETDTIGSTVRDNGFFIEIALESALEPTAVLDFYNGAFSGDDWHRVGIDQQPGGFRPAPVNAIFCYKGDDMMLNIFASNLSSGRTDVRMNIQSEADPYMCGDNSAEARGPYGPEAFLLIPALDTPDGMKISGQSGGSGGGGGGPYAGPTSAFQSATLEGDMPLADLADFYNAQLEAANWQAIDSISEKNIAWSSWTLKDKDGETWAGMLTITVNPLAENQYYALIQVNSGPQIEQP